MKSFFIALAIALCLPFAVCAQNTLNDKADSILGEYLAPSKRCDSKVRFTKNSDGTYNAQVFWLQYELDENGQVPVDVKNPDKSLRNRRLDQLVIIKGLKYNAAKKQWDGTKVYDPNRGISANVTINFLADGQLQLKGTIMGVGEKQVWKRVK